VKRVITENKVVEVVAGYLTAKNWRIVSTAKTIQHGPDVVALSSSGREIWIEAKGQTSSKQGTNRFGKEFNRNQKEDHLGRALLKCCQYLSDRADLILAIALPNDDLDSDLVRRISPALQRLKILTILVNEDGSVESSQDLASV
jgi:hypothetical protein